MVWTPLKNVSQLGWLFPNFPIYGKIKMFQTTNQIMVKCPMTFLWIGWENAGTNWSNFWLIQWIGWKPHISRENAYGFRCRFSLKPIHWTLAYHPLQKNLDSPYFCMWWRTNFNHPPRKYKVGWSSQYFGPIHLKEFLFTIMSCTPHAACLLPFSHPTDIAINIKYMTTRLH